jgi:cysteine desulfurase
MGRFALDELDRAREAVARGLGVRPSEVIWTSGSTESNNLAILGYANSDEGERRRKVLTVATEHKSVLDPINSLAKRGFSIEILPVSRTGTLDLQLLESHLSKGDIGLVSVMAANNETGVIHDVETIASISRACGARLHTDATQLLGKYPLPKSLEGFDYISFSGHKIYGPKGVGALIARSKSPLGAIQLGGGQENGRRSGTVNVAGAVGFATAFEISLRELEAGEASRVANLTANLMRKMEEMLDSIFIISGDAPRLGNTANIRFVGADADAVLANLSRVCVSTGSACNERTPGPSHVLRAMGLDQASEECIRFSLGRQTTLNDIEEAVGELVPVIHRIRKLNS